MTEATARTAIVTGEAAVTAAVGQAVGELGPPLVVNNAGVTRDNLIFKMTATFEEFTQRQLDKIPVGRAGQPEDIANLVAFLASEGAGFVSGQVIYAAGGPRS